MDINAQLKEDLREVSLVIDEATNDADSMVKAPLKQTFRNNGKLLRPSFMLWSARCGRSAKKRPLLMAAAAVELLHVSSLIHDDIIDDGTVRRGVPCVHSVFGNSVAVYTGDFTIIKSYKLLHDSGNDDLIYDFILATEKLCKSDIKQYRNRGNEISERDYMKIAAGKTGALFALSMKIGAKLGGLSDEICERFSQLGECFGIAFQIADDCLDYTVDGTVNKSVLGDLKQGLYTMPLILALKKDDGSLRSLLEKERTEENLAEICSKVHQFGGLEMSRRKVLELTGRCRALLRALPVTAENNYFSNLLDGMEEQNK